MPATLAALAFVFSAQVAGPVLGPPRVVAKGVRDVHWSPNSRALVYLQETDSGLALGVYDVERDVASTLRPLAGRETLESLAWLGSGTQALAVVRKGGESAETSLIGLDAKGQKLTLLWSRKAAEGEQVDVHVTPSPLLDHALIWIGTSTRDDERMQVEEDWVVLLGGKRAVPAFEVTEAKKQGYFFADWSKDGTAVFNNNGALMLSGVPIVGVLRSDSVSEQNGLSRIPGDVLVERFAGVTVSGSARKVLAGSVKPGATVLECMPSNAVMRQIRFQGAFEARPTEPAWQARPVMQSMREEKATVGVNSLWLAPVKGQESSWLPVLVSAQADLHWLASDQRGVAFVWNGALFVRTVR